MVLPVTTAWYPRSGGSIGEENGARRTSYCVPPAPTSLYTQVTGAHNHRLVERPRSGRESRAQGPFRPLGLIGVEIILTQNSPEFCSTSSDVHHECT
jgi:hypothetical protein